MKKVVEYCPYCECEVEVDAIKYVAQKCPKCGNTIRACCLCDHDKMNCEKCAKKYK